MDADGETDGRAMAYVEAFLGALMSCLDQGIGGRVMGWCFSLAECCLSEGVLANQECLPPLQ